MKNTLDKIFGAVGLLVILAVIGYVMGETVITDNLINTTQNLSIGAFISNIIPYTDDTYNIGNSSHQAKDIYIDGVAYVDQLGETLDANNQIITNIGAAGTDFNSTGGLTLADALGGTDGTFSGALASVTLDTGQGANELYDMDQNVLQASSPTFAGATIGTLTGIINASAGVLSAITTSAGIANAISDETGTGLMVFGTLPTITLDGSNITAGTVADARLETQIDRTGFTASGFVQTPIVNSSGDIAMMATDQNDYFSFSTTGNSPWIQVVGGANRGGMYCDTDPCYLYISNASRSIVNAVYIGWTESTQSGVVATGAGDLIIDATGVLQILDEINASTALGSTADKCVCTLATGYLGTCTCASCTCA